MRNRSSFVARVPRARKSRTLLGRLATAGAVALALRGGLRMRRDLLDFRRSDARLREHWTRIAGIAGDRPLRLHARSGDAARTVYPPIVLVHGLGIGSAYLVPLAARLARHAHTHAPELPGHGASDHDARPLTTRELAYALAAWMDANELRSAILVGHSLGCQIAAEVAARRPDLATGLVLVGPTSDPAAPTPTAVLARGLRGLPYERASAGIWAARDYRRAGIDVLAAEVRDMLEHRIEDVLPDVRAPVRIVRGSHDAIVPQRWAEAIARLVDAPAPTVVEGWGHAVLYDAPDAIVKVVFSLVRSLREAAQRAPVVASTARPESPARGRDAGEIRAGGPD